MLLKFVFPFAKPKDRLKIKKVPYPLFTDSGLLPFDSHDELRCNPVSNTLLLDIKICDK